MIMSGQRFDKEIDYKGTANMPKYIETKIQNLTTQIAQLEVEEETYY